ncbi:hypothetical protein AMATHDRAFT_7615 [Amanita thiersii Skay4041]|uniref:Uncharacterized protein n=1 Tax=Amanita thiersii Skay4041 TaxID=703135 RepID=A0A2A9NEB6_9AGAR|nr:hypothetical protein AMATHDRAFT_7615 [Amanita thiersii Skay4041]
MILRPKRSSALALILSVISCSMDLFSELLYARRIGVFTQSKVAVRWIYLVRDKDVQLPQSDDVSFHLQLSVIQHVADLVSEAQIVYFAPILFADRNANLTKLSNLLKSTFLLNILSIILQGLIAVVMVKSATLETGLSFEVRSAVFTFITLLCTKFLWVTGSSYLTGLILLPKLYLNTLLVLSNKPLSSKSGRDEVLLEKAATKKVF